MARTVFTFLLLGWLAAAPALAAGPGPVYQRSAPVAFEAAYRQVYEALEARRFWVIFEARISDNIGRFAERWGEDYNRNDLTGIRSMLVCNPWYTNQIGNADPAMLALCPLRVVVIGEGETSRALFARPTVPAADSPAREVLAEVEGEIIAAIDAALGDGDPGP